MRHVPQVQVLPSGHVLRYGVLSGERVLICGATPKYVVDCAEFFRNTFSKVELKKR